ncbi:hypothetical protein BGZ90_010049 [Linnemannia elongata]|nr:hypothetical protein BGZ90_010049 [Linnemannia elongata]
MPGSKATEDNDDNEDLATVIARSCPRLCDMTSQHYLGEDDALLLRIMDALPPQQVEQLRCSMAPWKIRGLDAAAMFRRHSTTLRTLLLNGCRNVRSKAIKVLLNECRGIEKLEVFWGASRRELCIDLEDAIELPWVCTQLESLMLTIAVPDEPLHLHSGTKPYYDRTPPTTLSEAEKDQFKQLEAFYCQIGTLTELTQLILNVFYYDPQGVRPLSVSTQANTFPGMLSLGDCRYGRPGFLHHLAGLTNLRVLGGSVSATTDETSVTMGRAEAEWITTMKPATQRLFAIPELVATLTTYLNRKEISRLMQTSRQLQELCTPAHYRRIPATYQPGKNNILRNVEPILALSKNVHHSLNIDLYEYYDQDGEYEDDYGVLDPGESRIWEKTDEECGLTTTPRRQEPLVHLKNLDMRAVEEDVSETDLLSMLQHCPNLCDLGLPRMEEIIDSSNLATAIAESCPALSEVTFKKYGEGMADGTLTLRIMDRLPSQQVKRYRCDDVSFIIPGLDAGSLFRRHSSTLQRLSLGGCDNFDSKAIQVFLVECRALEVLEMRRLYRLQMLDSTRFLEY